MNRAPITHVSFNILVLQALKEWLIFPFFGVIRGLFLKKKSKSSVFFLKTSSRSHMVSFVTRAAWFPSINVSVPLPAAAIRGPNECNLRGEGLFWTGGHRHNLSRKIEVGMALEEAAGHTSSINLEAEKKNEGILLLSSLPQ